MMYHACSNTVFLTLPFTVNAGPVGVYTIEAVISLFICLYLNRKKHFCVVNRRGGEGAAGRCLFMT